MTTAMTTRVATEVATTTDRRAADRGADGAAGGRPVASRAYDSDVIERRKVLLVEDERSISGPLAAALEREGFDATVAGTASEALELASEVVPDLVLLDLMLPDGSGFDVCRELRRTSDVPVVMLTARADEADRIVGLELGADDYVVKPFSAREVIARVRAVLRRTTAPARGAEEGGRVEIGDLTLDRERRSAALAGEELDLSRKEFDLLERLMRAAGTCGDARAAHRGRLGHELVRLHKDPRRPRLGPAAKAGRRRRRAALHPHRPRCGLPLLGAVGSDRVAG